MKNRCMFGDGSCPKEQEWHCHILRKDWSSADRSLCDEHADYYMKANIQSGYGAFAKKAIK